MKVNIGPFRRDIIPVSRWLSKYEQMREKQLGLYPLDAIEPEHYLWYDHLIIGALNGLVCAARPINNFFKNRARKEYVRVDGYDVWNADHTIALLVHPILVKLKGQQHGAGLVDKEDVPEHLHSNPEPFEAWNYVLDEMIWAFEQCTKPDRGDDQFHHNIDQLEMLSKPSEEFPGMHTIEFNHQKDPSKPKYYVDNDAKMLHYKRIENGLRLFAKYYFNLWD